MRRFLIVILATLVVAGAFTGLLIYLYRTRFVRTSLDRGSLYSQVFLFQFTDQEAADEARARIRNGEIIRRMKAHPMLRGKSWFPNDGFEVTATGSGRLVPVHADRYIWARWAYDLTEFRHYKDENAPEAAARNRAVAQALGDALSAVMEDYADVIRSPASGDGSSAENP